MITINKNEAIPLSKQIYVSFVDKIRSGLLTGGTKLPTVRQLAKDIEVSLVTVMKAYKQLEEDGFLELSKGKGTYVKNQQHSEPSKTGHDFDWQLSIPDYLHRSQYARFQDSDASYHFSSSMIDPALFPNQYMDQLIAQVFMQNPRILSQYGGIQGDLALREKMVQNMEKSKITTTPENLLITSGSQQGIDLVARTFIGPGDVVIMEAPTYPGAIDVFRSRGATILTVPVDEDGMRVDMLHSLCEKHKPKLIYTTPTFHNPTGTIMPLQRRKVLLDIAESHHCLIMEDDPFSDIYFDRKPPLPIKSMDKTGHVIYLKGLSKTIAPGCRIGLIAASGSIFKRLYAAKANMDLGSPLLPQKVILPLVDSTKMEQHLKRLRAALKSRRDSVLAILTEQAPSGVTWHIPKGGLNVWIQLPAWLDSNVLLYEANKRHVSFLTGSACFAIENEHSTFRLSYSYANEKLLREGVMILCDIMQAMQPASSSSPTF
ncbi:DNA-binding transcriptional regulator, MocR family, contains an aminotransferase domain [Terribacillus saccharophilus]|uniref:DNA-binding transcriptional regulator, MocR family, contains an aminotransferase domain n=1 Tax=Terribacillus saccharophilus TaxID=361277 RepID=A0AAX2EEC5_9BACI|nr:DNA-binding transcriptional regulator, MocR family, contains an aminotransferase domain [Terribacillus saccharophilus]